MISEPMDIISTIKERYPDLGVSPEDAAIVQGYLDCHKDIVVPLQADVVRLKQALAECGGRNVIVYDLLNALRKAHATMNEFGIEIDVESLETMEEANKLKR